MLRTRIAAAAVGALVLLLCAMTAGEEVKGLGFYPPFKTFNARGERTVASWTLTGASAVKQSFARITPDRVLNTGTMYSRLTGRLNSGPPLGEFSLAMTFRVSGEKDKHHGNHLAMVVGNPEKIRKKGPTFGFQENFVGVGVLITTRAPAILTEPDVENDRPLGPRQFVSFFANNGTRTTTDVKVLANSCASTVRYAQSRDDFNFLRSSRVRLGFYDGEVSLEVDARNIGVWRKCISTKVDDMPEKWLDRVGVAISAETGEWVSNNHDVMSLEFYSERAEAFDKRVVDGATEEDPEEASQRAEDDKRSKRMAAIQAHMEHEFDAVERILKDSLASLALMSDEMDKRLDTAEQKMNKDVFAYLNSRVKGIEERVKTNAVPALESRLKGVERDFNDEMGESMADMLDKTKGWRAPFLFMLVVLFGMIGVAFVQYRKLMKSSYVGGYR